MIFDHYDRIQIVSLPRRHDRRRAMLRELRNAGQAGNGRISFFDAIRVDDRGVFRSVGSHGCYLSHLQLLTEAADAGHSVLILQDDCTFLPTIRDPLELADCDIFYGGFLASNPSDLHGSDIIGAHFMGFSDVAARKASIYLRNLLDPGFPADPAAAAQPGFDPAVRPPIDGACVWFRRAHPELKTMFHLVANQRSSRSDITPARFFDRIWGLRALSSVARHVRRQWVRSDGLEQANPSFVRGGTEPRR